ncbi:MAG: right-handed parallel beta-helix repeat-containing protein [Thermoanaerobaculia bacterium]
MCDNTPQPRPTTQRGVLLLSGLLAIGGIAGADDSQAGWAVSLQIEPAVAAGLPDGTGLRPLSLVSEDLNGDGSPDLAAGYATLEGRGAVLAWDGAGSSTRDGGDPSFASLLGTWSLDSPPDLLAAGDFDADGVVDLVAATLGGRELTALVARAGSPLAGTRTLELGGALTTLHAGEANRADGLPDLVVGVVAANGTALVRLFEGPRGALEAAPLDVPLPGPARTATTLELDGKPGREVVIAAGSGLFVLEGRDRHLSGGPRSGAEDRVELRRLDGSSTAGALTAGSWIGRDRRRELLVLEEDGALARYGWDGRSTARAPWGVGDRLHGARTVAAALGTAKAPVLVTGGYDGLHLVSADGTREVAEIWSDPVVAAVPLRRGIDAVTDIAFLVAGDPRPMIAGSVPRQTITVTSDQDDEVSGDGQCTLREALNNANAGGSTAGGDCTEGSAGLDTIAFDIAPPTVHTIVLQSALPEVVDPVVVDGDSEACSTSPCIVVDGSGLSGNDPIWILSAGSSTLHGLGFVHPDFGAVSLRDGGQNVVEACRFLGPATPIPRSDRGLDVTSPDNLIGGTAEGAANRFEGFDIGVLINNSSQIPGSNAVGNRVEGNLVGCPPPPSSRGACVPDVGGIYIANAAMNTIGGAAAGAGNVVVGNDGVAISIIGTDPSQGSAAELNLVQGNRIGLDDGGTSIAGNLGGIYVTWGNLNTIGGTTPAVRNVVVDSRATPAGSPAYPGIGVTGTFHGEGVGNLVQGNYVGTDATGMRALGNERNGIYLDMAGETLVGGTVAGSGNLVAANGTDGIEVQHTPVSRPNFVQGNVVGLNATLSAALPNGAAGIRVTAPAGDVVGSSGPGGANIVAGNIGDGIVLDIGGDASVVGNWIGVTPTIGGVGNGGVGLLVDRTLGAVASGNTVRENGSHGVWIDGGSQTLLTANTIQDNGGAGIAVTDADADRNTLFDNSLASNAGLGIDLGDDGPTANDPGDGDVGPNRLQNYPVLETVFLSGGSSLVAGSLNSQHDWSFTIDVYSSPSCDPSGSGEAESLVGSFVVTTDALGLATFDVVLPEIDPGRSVVATATDELGSTSELSLCVDAAPLLFSDGFESGDASAWTAVVP